MYVIEEKPQWVNKIDLDLDDIVQTAQNGVYWILTEVQHYVTDEYVFCFNRSAKCVVHENGLENLRHFMLAFNPTVTTIKLHELYILREKKEKIDLILPENISISDFKQDYCENVFDNNKHLIILLEDLRLNDIIISSFTTRTENKKYSSLMQFNYDCPVEKIYRRVICDIGHKLNFKLFNTNEAIVVNDKEIIFEKRHVSPVSFEDRIPSWFTPFAFLQVTEYQSWNEVAKWMAKYFVVSEETTPLIKAQCDELIAHNPSDEGKIIAALRFVQNQIRYTYLPFDEHTPTPHPPEIVMQRRFGDCKDKSLLLVTILKKLGVEAYPVLVNNVKRINLDYYLPDSSIFNHAIVCICFNGRKYFFDPTIGYEFGDLEHAEQALYGAVLILNETTECLYPCFTGALQKPTLEIEDVYIVDAINFDKIHLQINTINSGSHANFIRKFLAQNDRHSIDDQFLNFLLRFFSKVELKESMRIVEDDQNRNILKTVENYLITLPSISPNKGKTVNRALEVPIYNFFNRLSKPNVIMRQQPLFLAFPVYTTQQCRIKLPGKIKHLSLNKQIGNEYFSFKQEIRGVAKREILCTQSFQTKKDHIPASDIKMYLQDAQKVIGQCFLVFPISRNLFSFAGKRTVNKIWWWLAFIIFALSLLLNRV
jgi:hypothetical protein